jgi:hypothetical protein
LCVLKCYKSLLQCCGSGMFIPDTDFYPSRISDPDPKTAIKDRGVKKLVVISFFVAINFTKLKIILFLECSGVYILVENGYLFPPPLGNIYFFPKKTA